MSFRTASTDTATLIRRSLFFVVLIILTLGNLFILFRGLNSAQAMDQAQIAREISRGNGFTTKFIRPIAYNQVERAKGGQVSMTGFQDTYNSPLNPLINAAVFKLIGANDADAWQMGDNEVIFPLDRVVATVCTLCFLMAIGVNYLLISRIFDPKIAAVSAILMLFCETFWNYSLSGLPQMLMLLLFSCALYFAYLAIEASSEGRVPLTPALISGLFFTLLALTHWLTLWIAVGYIIFAALVFRPRGLVAMSIFGLLLLAAIGPMIRNYAITGSPFGTAYLALYNGLTGGGADGIMRIHDTQSAAISFQGFVPRTLRIMLLQASEIVPLLAGIVVAPLFFISLLHPFKRSAISTFRWGILLMWATTAIGLSFYGVSTTGLDPNQIHLLFAPIMTAYGLALISVLWNRMELLNTIPWLKDAHYIAVVAICALPLVLGLPQKVILGMTRQDRGGVPNWPPYFATPLNLVLKRVVAEKNSIMSDQPWAVAWYADRLSIWMPKEGEGFARLETAAMDQGRAVSGILITPVSHGDGGLADIANRSGDFTALVMDGRVLLATNPPGLSINDKNPKVEAITKRYPFRLPLVGMDMIYYSDRALRQGAK